MNIKKHLEEEYGYRFFVDSYINESTAVGMASGARLAGVKSCVFIDLDRIHEIMGYLSTFNLEYKIHILIVAKHTDKDVPYTRILSMYKIPYRVFNNKSLKSALNQADRQGKPLVLVVGAGK